MSWSLQVDDGQPIDFVGGAFLAKTLAKPATRSRTISTKLTPEQYSILAKHAGSRGYSISEYVRHQVVTSVGLHSDTRFLAAELLAFQETFLALILASLRAEPLNENRVAELRARFAGIKSALVDQALEQFQSSDARNV
jgi:hypothetical protein